MFVNILPLTQCSNVHSIYSLYLKCLLADWGQSDLGLFVGRWHQMWLFFLLFFPDIVFTRHSKSTEFSHFGVNTKGACSSHNSAFFYRWSFTPFKTSLFIGRLYRPCLLFFTPFTPLSLGCLPLHFMPTSITLHWSKWGGPSSVSALCLLNASPSGVCSRKLFCNIPKCASEMSFVLLKPSGEITARKGLKKALHLRLHISKVASVFALNIQGQQDESCLLERPKKEIWDATHLFPYRFNMQDSQPPFFLLVRFLFNLRSTNAVTY